MGYHLLRGLSPTFLISTKNTLVGVLNSESPTGFYKLPIILLTDNFTFRIYHIIYSGLFNWEFSRPILFFHLGDTAI